MSTTSPKSPLNLPYISQVSQASSIQNWGVTLESFTLGHNPTKLGLSASAVFLPRARKLFLCEYVLEKGEQGKTRS